MATRDDSGDGWAALDATAQAALVRSGEATPTALVEAAIARIEKLDPALNAVIHPLFEKARAQAADPDALGAGPFRGVPFLVKDAVCQTAGDPYHCGMQVAKRAGYRATHDTELARRFRRAGFVFVGKTNTPELAMSAVTEPRAYGATRNPWSLAHSPGGSSGGSAAAVAAGLVPVAHANDMGGSIRLPASFCGLVGLKPTRARSTIAPDHAEYWGPLTHEHVVTRSVRDSAAVLDAICGPAVGDPYTAPPPLRAFASALERDPAALRVGVLAAHPHVEVDAACRDAVERAAALCERLGHRVERAALPALERPALGPWISVGIARDLDAWSERTGVAIGPDDVEPLNAMMAEAGRAMSAVAYARDAEAAFAWSRELQQWWRDPDADVLLLPTSPELPPRVGALAPDVPLDRLLGGLGRITAFTMPFDVTGQPAISLPLHASADGLPVGVQLVAAYGREDVLLALAAQLERAAPWSARRPAVHA